MNDTKNILIAWISSITTVFTAIETRTLITIVSAIVLPILFFSIGKAIDVYIQFYLRRKRRRPRISRSQMDQPERK